MNHCLLLACVISASSALAAQNDIVFQSSTEDWISGWTMPAESLAASLVTFSDLNDLANDCINEKGLSRNYRQFLVSKRIPLSTSGSKFSFVRPTSKLYCGAFYGAHTYSFWVVDHNRGVIFSSTADEFAILQSSHEGMRDLLVSGCHGGYCYRTTMLFSGGAYKKGSCSTTEIQTNKTVPGCVLP
jgi:hypothetical protein